EIIKATQFTSAHEKPLLITDYSMASGIALPAFMTTINEFKSDNIYVLIATPDIEHIEKLLTVNNYSDIIVINGSDALVKNLKSQFGERMDSLEMEGILPTWSIKLE
ncbi:hypothetical protein MUO66_04390, partial [Candidatus Bathyarchaeota archaeon]|nr:hypothetical protein [Candidatus Bathyarchaeota archaeon]